MDFVHGRMKGDPFGCAPIRRYHIHIAVAVVFCGKCDPFSVLGKTWVGFVAYPARKALGFATAKGGLPKVVGVHEHHGIVA